MLKEGSSNVKNNFNIHHIKDIVSELSTGPTSATSNKHLQKVVTLAMYHAAYYKS